MSSQCCPVSLGNKLTLNDVNVQAKNILVRVDFNVPLDSNGKITNDSRIVAALPTIKKLMADHAKRIVLISHLGRPDGKRIDSMSLRPVALELERLLKQPIVFIDDCVGETVQEECARTKEGAIVLLENLRFHPEEEVTIKLVDGTKRTASQCDVSAFCASLSSLGDIYVNDAFGTVHRAHSSINGISIPIRVAGLLVERELKFFSRLLESPEKIEVAVLGGAKVADKIKLIENLLPRVKNLVIGGGMVYTFMKVARKMDIGKSLYDPEGAEIVMEILSNARKAGVNVHFPTDFMAADRFANDAIAKIVSVDEGIPDDWLGLDIGPTSSRAFCRLLSSSRTILWNGPMGVFEFENFSHGTKSVLDGMIEATANGAITVIGGGDSATAAAKWGAESKVSHVSTGGGASLELLEGRQLPGIAYLSSKC